MPLIRCKECNRQVSDKAATCPNCGAPVGGGGTMGSIVFERRIEQYKANGYKLIKRDGNTVTMRSSKTPKGVWSFMVLMLIILIVVGFIVGVYSSMLFMYIIFISGGVYMIISMQKKYIVTISLNTVGKVEEQGNTIKK